MATFNVDQLKSTLKEANQRNQKSRHLHKLSSLLCLSFFWSTPFFLSVAIPSFPSRTVLFYLTVGKEASNLILPIVGEKQSPRPAVSTEPVERAELREVLILLAGGVDGCGRFVLSPHHDDMEINRGRLWERWTPERERRSLARVSGLSSGGKKIKTRFVTKPKARLTIIVRDVCSLALRSVFNILCSAFALTRSNTWNFSWSSQIKTLHSWDRSSIITSRSTFSG